MNIEKPLSVLNAKYNANGSINADVEWAFLGDGIAHPFTASPDDVADHGRQLFEDLKAGVYGEVAPYTDKDAARDKHAAAEYERSQLIDEASGLIRPLSDERDAGIISDDDLGHWKAWVAYRKALRELDVTATDIEWPAKPE